MARRKQHTSIVPPQGIPAVALRINLAEGEHPSQLIAFTSLHNLSAINPEAETLLLELPVAPLTDGHHHMEDEGYKAAMGQADIWPLAPVFVRDVAGRVVHTGLNPLPVPPPFPIMPETCQYVPPETEGYGLLDKTFFTSFRTLEWGYGEGTVLTGRPTYTAHALYPAPQLYPYKLRVDSFYQDGFRLPQVERLYVQPSNPLEATKHGDELIARWNARPAGQTYQEFYEANEGDAWFETMFQAGCTVVPTLEATNGSYVVDDAYGLVDAWPGCVVEGLHEVADYKPDASPAGTIVEVLQPGYATRAGVVPAKVVASDGSGYVSRVGDVPEPMQPDPQLPHPRVGNFAGVWLPTHPGHFELPALWDWNAQGHFQQMAGPLWDPVHYTYTSTPRILKAFRSVEASTPHQAPVPEDMLPRFHPVCGLKTYDTFNTATARMRGLQAGASPLHDTWIDAVPLGRTVADVGYHPLPPALEYELDPAVFPNLSPRNITAEAGANLAPVITSMVTAEEAAKLMVIHAEPDRRFMLNPTNFEGGYGLERFTQPEPPTERQPQGWMMLPDITTSDLMVNVKRFFMSKAYVDRLKKLHPTLYKQFYVFREQALAWRRLRHRLARKYVGWYQHMWWFGHTPTHTETQVREQLEYRMLEAERSLKAQTGLMVRDFKRE
ncbi:MAG: hypothetical protein WAZ18_00345 [Alphaproteobacteria bacterium]